MGATRIFYEDGEAKKCDYELTLNPVKDIFLRISLEL
jgi:hypothetical protein